MKVLVTFIFMALFFAFTTGCTSLYAYEPSGDPVAFVKYLEGSAYIINEKDHRKRELEKLGKLYIDDLVILRGSASVKIEFNDKNLVFLTGGAHFKIREFEPQKRSVLDLLFGKLRAFVKNKYTGSQTNRFEVKSKNAVAGVRGSSFYMFVSSKGRTVILPTTGKVYVQKGPKKLSLKLNRVVSVKGSGEARKIKMLPAKQTTKLKVFLDKGMPGVTAEDLKGLHGVPDAVLKKEVKKEKEREKSEFDRMPASVDDPIANIEVQDIESAIPLKPISYPATTSDSTGVVSPQSLSPENSGDSTITNGVQDRIKNSTTLPVKIQLKFE